MVRAGRCTALSLLNRMYCGRSRCDTESPRAECPELCSRWGRHLIPYQFLDEAKGLKSSSLAHTNAVIILHDPEAIRALCDRPHAWANQLHRHMNLFPLPCRACDSVTERLSPVQPCAALHQHPSMTVVLNFTR